MGVSFYVCTRCERTYPDCSSTREDCDEDRGGCGAGYCSKKCAELQRPGHDEVPTWGDIEEMPREEFEALELTCVNCRGENASDENLLAFMLKRHGVTRKQVAAEYMASRQSGTDVQSDAEGVK